MDMQAQPQARLQEIYRSLIVERESLLERARAIASQCNGLAPISKLAPEILLRIFALNSGPFDKEKTHRIRGNFRDPRPFDPTKDLRSISQVCQHWRILALGSPTLWSVLLDCILPPQWMIELLNRSQSLPLKIRVDLSAQLHRALANFRLTRTEFHRLEEFIAFTDDLGIVKMLFKLMTQPLPMLRSLTLALGHDRTTCPEEGEITEDEEYESHSESESDDEEYEEYGPFLPDFPDKTCKILTLNTRGCLFRLDSPLYQNLTDLSVFDIDRKAPQICEWLSSLQTTENLTSLVLVNTFSKHSNLYNLPQLSLPHLTDLRLVGHYAPCSQFLMHLTINPLRSFDIRFRHLNLSDPGLIKLVDAIIPHLAHHATSTSFDTLKIIFKDSLFQFTNTDSPRKLKPYFRVFLASEENSSSDSSDSDSESDDSADNYRRLSHLMMRQVLAALMAPFVSLKLLRIDYETTAYLINVDLHNASKKEKPTTKKQQPFPFSPGQPQSLTISCSNVVVAFETLMAYLIRRAELGKPLEQLKFTESIFDTMPVKYEKLRPYCGTLIWERPLGDDNSSTSSNADLYGLLPGGDYDGDRVSAFFSLANM